MAEPERAVEAPAARRRRMPGKPGEGRSEFSIWTMPTPPGSSVPDWARTALITSDGMVLAPAGLGPDGEAATMLRAVNAGVRVASHGGNCFADLAWLRASCPDRAELLGMLGQRARREIQVPLTALERRRNSDARKRAAGYERVTAWLSPPQLRMLDALAKDWSLVDRTNTVAFAVRVAFAQARKHQNLMVRHRAREGVRSAVEV